MSATIASKINAHNPTMNPSDSRVRGEGAGNGTVVRAGSFALKAPGSDGSAIADEGGTGRSLG